MPNTVVIKSPASSFCGASEYAYPPSGYPQQNHIPRPNPAVPSVYKFSPVAVQGQEKIKFLRRKINRSSVFLDQSLFHYDFDIPEADHGFRHSSPIPLVRLIQPPEDRANSGDYLPQIEGLRNVVICTKF